MWQHTSVILVLRKLRQENLEFKASLGYWPRPVSKQTKAKVLCPRLMWSHLLSLVGICESFSHSFTCISCTWHIVIFYLVSYCLSFDMIVYAICVLHATDVVELFVFNFSHLIFDSLFLLFFSFLWNDSCFYCFFLTQLVLVIYF
jgi:hypothetical protein